MAGIRKVEKNGRPYYVVDVSVTETGRTRRRQQHFRIDPADPGRAKLEAEAYAGEMARQVARAKLARDGGRAMGPRDVEVADWLDRFAIVVRPNMGGTYHAILVYTLNKLTRHLAEHGVNTSGQLRREHWSGYVEAMQAKGNKSKSISNDLSAIKRAVRWGIDEGYLDPTLVRAFPRVRVVKHERRALTVKEVDAAPESHRRTRPTRA